MQLKFGIRMLLPMTMIFALAACQLPSQSEVADGGMEKHINVNPLRPGMWGSSEATLSVSPDGAHLLLGCGSADILGQVLLDPQNNFAVDGTLTSGGGAMPVQGFPSYPARINGNVAGDILKLYVKSEAGGREFELELKYNYSGTNELIRCL